jgi:S1-C subfamily serine protease
VTTGSVNTDSFETVNGRDFESRAYSVALRTLLSDPEFRALRALETGTTMATAPAADGPALPAMHFRMPAPLPGGSQANAEALRRAVVTVMHDNVSGSGFYIADGFLLTNHHVVGATHYVKVKLASGRVVVGEVVRDDNRRDAALVKTESVGIAPLRVSVAEPRIGEDVFAIGSPLGQELAGTFTRGVMSGTRQVNGLDYLQSDVAINPGNSGGPLLDGSSTVIGMAVLKIDKAAGLSFFIPLRDAANALQLVFD